MPVQSRIQRKQSKQLRFLSKLQDGQRTSSVTKTIVKKKRLRAREKVAKALGSLSSLADSLPSQEEIVASAQTLKKKVRAVVKSHEQVVLNETKQLAAVLAHPEFQSNPFLAIQKHLSNTLPADDLPPRKEATMKTRGKKKGKTTKKKKSQSGSDMDE